MHSDTRTQATMLLTATLGRSDRSGAKPLSIREWARFAVWLKDHELEPASLLKCDLPSVLSGWADGSITVPRLEELLGRGGALGLALERWQRAGLWVMTRSDPEYPRRLKERLGQESPPVLYGCGDRAILNRGGIAVVGSRDASEHGLAFTERLGSDAAGQDVAIVSGGARGVDQRAMLGALENDGVAVGVLADSLLRSATSAKYRKHVASGCLVLISPFNPEARFNVGNAMNRNRYVYCLSDAGVVIGSKTGKGGTWSGAIEDLEAGWVPLWVKRSLDAGSGNPELWPEAPDGCPKSLAPSAALQRAIKHRSATKGGHTTFRRLKRYSPRHPRRRRPDLRRRRWWTMRDRWPVFGARTRRCRPRRRPGFPKAWASMSCSWFALRSWLPKRRYELTRSANGWTMSRSPK